MATFENVSFGCIKPLYNLFLNKKIYKQNNAPTQYL